MHMAFHQSGWDENQDWFINPSAFCGRHPKWGRQVKSKGIFVLIGWQCEGLQALLDSYTGLGDNCSSWCPLHKPHSDKHACKQDSDGPIHVIKIRQVQEGEVITVLGITDLGPTKCVTNVPENTVIIFYYKYPTNKPGFLWINVFNNFSSVSISEKTMCKTWQSQNLWQSFKLLLLIRLFRLTSSFISLSSFILVVKGSLRSQSTRRITLRAAQK